MWITTIQMNIERQITITIYESLLFSNRISDFLDHLKCCWQKVCFVNSEQSCWDILYYYYDSSLSEGSTFMNVRSTFYTDTHTHNSE